MLKHRASGVLLHPTSLPGLLGSGDLGEDAYRFVDWLQAAGQQYWQILPIGPIGPGNSPYMSCSAFAGNELLIDLRELAELGWLSEAALTPLPGFRNESVDYAAVIDFRMSHARQAYEGFLRQGTAEQQASFNAFCRDEAEWLIDYALFRAIDAVRQGESWNQWPVGLAKREAGALRAFERKHVSEVGFWKFLQWCFCRQWSRLKQYANEHQVQILGDMPIFVAYQSADVWAHQALFELGEDGRQTVVAGVPPDYFSETGQLWGNPLYRWPEHESSHFEWWIARVRHALRFADMIRIDHFRGFSAYWEIPAGASVAIGGCWVDAPGEKLFAALVQAIPGLPVIAEDLGVITEEVVALRDQFELPGMRVLQFAFGGGEDNHFLPHHYIANTAAYLGTHDNDTTLSWWDGLSEHEKDFVRRYFETDGSDIVWTLITALENSSAHAVIFAMQDVLGLGGEARMNFPGKADGNWGWRFCWSQVPSDIADKLRACTLTGARLDN